MPCQRFWSTRINSAQNETLQAVSGNVTLTASIDEPVADIVGQCVPELLWVVASL
jgi:hypothetical protein